MAASRLIYDIQGSYLHSCWPLHVHSLKDARITCWLSQLAVNFMSGMFHKCLRLSAFDSHLRNIKEAKAVHPPVSVAPLLASDPSLTIRSVSIRPNGAPILTLSNNTVLSYDGSLLSFIKLSDAWFSQGSSYWKGRQRGNSNTESRSVVASIEARITERTQLDPSLAEIPRPTWWTPAMTLGHLETRMNAARSLDSAAEYKQALLLYAKTIADEGFRGKAEELLKELYGPVYWYVLPYIRNSLFLS